MEEEESDLSVLAPNLISIIESSILTFHHFLKMDKKKSGGVRNVFGSQNQMVSPLQQIQASLEKVRLIFCFSLLPSFCYNCFSVLITS